MDSNHFESEYGSGINLEDQLQGAATNDAVKRLLDPKFYLENFTKVKSKEGGLVPLRFKEAQKDIANTVKTSPRTMILKARQIGFSTIITALLYHRTIMSEGVNTVLVGYNTDMAAELLDKVKTLWASTPTQLQPTIQYNSKYEVSFPKMQSKIIVLPSSDNVGRGYTIHNALLTEFSAWENAEQKMAAIENAVPMDTGKIIIETTPRGIGNMFHRMWMNENNGYAKKEYGWWWEYTPEQIEVIKARMNNPRLFAQEYDLAFLASGRNVFDTDLMDEMQRKNVLKIGDTYVDPETKKTETVREWEGLTVYREPRPGGIYVAGADVAEGVTDGDFSVVSIYDRTSGDEVGFWRGHLPADKFAEKLNRWGRFFNNAMMVVEINNHGLTTVTALKNLMYPTLYFRPVKFDSISGGWSDRLGWKTTRTTRPLMIDDLAQALRDGVLTPHNEHFYKEVMTFVYDDGNNMVAQGGYHDDCIFSTAIGLQGFKIMYDKPLTQVDYNNYLPQGGGY